MVYRGRFAPSPTGPLHAGSLVAALASWLDARAHAGAWLVRIEDIDPPRCQPGADARILSQLATCGLHPDEAPVWQSHRHRYYAQALASLQHAGWAYGCACTRKAIEAHWLLHGVDGERHVERPYPGLCRAGLGARPARSWRFALTDVLSSLPHQASVAHSSFTVSHGRVLWQDRRLGPQTQQPAHTVGDFVLQRADGLYAYQLAVVVDDALQGITHVVRGEDLTDNTPRQLLLQHALGYTAPSYLHTPLVRMPDGEKLSKQHGAPPVDLHDPVHALNAAAAVLQLPTVSPDTALPDALAHWVKFWQHTYNR